MLFIIPMHLNAEWMLMLLIVWPQIIEIKVHGLTFHIYPKDVNLFAYFLLYLQYNNKK